MEGRGATRPHDVTDSTVASNTSPRRACRTRTRRTMVQHILLSAGGLRPRRAPSRAHSRGPHDPRSVHALTRSRSFAVTESHPLLMSLALETTGLRKVFGDLVAGAGIDLAVPRGSFYGFLGPNGAGKSTTIKCLTGLLSPSGGTCRILGTDPFADPVAVKKKIGVVPEDLALFDRLSGVETLAFVGHVHGLDRSSVRT